MSPFLCPILPAIDLRREFVSLAFGTEMGFLEVRFAHSLIINLRSMFDKLVFLVVGGEGGYRLSGLGCCG